MGVTSAWLAVLACSVCRQHRCRRGIDQIARTYAMTDRPPVAANKPAQRHPSRHHRSRTTMPGCAIPAIPRSPTRTCSPISRPRTPSSKRAMAPHKPLVDTLFEEMKGAHQGGRFARCRRRTATGSTGSSSRKAAQYRKWWRKPVAGGAGRADPRRAGAGRGQGIFPARRDLGQPRRQAARLCDRRQWLGTLHRPGQGPGDRRACCPTRSPARCRRWSGSPTTAASSMASPTSSGGPTMPGCTGSARRSPSDIELYHEDDEGFRVGVGADGQREVDRHRDRRP